jgi:hypothetical protein
VLDKTAVLLVGGETRIRVFEETGSSTLTVRVSAHADAALAVPNVKAISKIVGGTPPSGF